MTSTGDPATAALASFTGAPEAIQRQFWQQIARVAEAEHTQAQAVFESYGVWPTGHSHRLPAWDADWRRRADVWRIGEERGFRDNGVTPESIDALKSIPASAYVERLVGEEVPRHRKIPCPLPDHDERTPSFHVYDLAWRCFGCGAKGTIYDLAGALWGIEPRGNGFVEIHRRLMEAFA